MPSLRAFYAQITLSWGFVVRHRDVSAAQPAFTLPPPTTIVGAFTYPLLRLLNIDPYRGEGKVHGEHRLISPVMKPLLQSTKAASAAIVGRGQLNVHTGIIVHQELGKLVAAPYRGGGGWEKAKRTRAFTSDFFTEALPQALAVQAVGTAYGPGANLELLWIFDAEELCKSLDIKLDQLDKAGEKAVHGVVRIGSKEGIVAVNHDNAVYEKKVEVVKAGEKLRTRFYVEKGCVEPMDVHLVYEISLPGLLGKPETFYIPSLSGSNVLIVPLPEHQEPPRFTLLEPCRGYRLSTGVVGVGR